MEGTVRSMMPSEEDMTGLPICELKLGSSPSTQILNMNGFQVGNWMQAANPKGLSQDRIRVL
jgi:hypothetical protein